MKHRAFMSPQTVTDHLGVHYSARGNPCVRACHVAEESSDEDEGGYHSPVWSADEYSKMEDESDDDYQSDAVGEKNVLDSGIFCDEPLSISPPQDVRLRNKLLDLRSDLDNKIVKRYVHMLPIDIDLSHIQLEIENLTETSTDAKWDGKNDTIKSLITEIQLLCPLLEQLENIKIHWRQSDWLRVSVSYSQAQQLLTAAEACWSGSKVALSGLKTEVVIRRSQIVSALSEMLDRSFRIKKNSGSFFQDVDCIPGIELPDILQALSCSGCLAPVLNTLFEKISLYFLQPASVNDPANVSVTFNKCEFRLAIAGRPRGKECSIPEDDDDDVLFEEVDNYFTNIYMIVEFIYTLLEQVDDGNLSADSLSFFEKTVTARLYGLLLSEKSVLVSFIDRTKCGSQFAKLYEKMHEFHGQIAPFGISDDLIGYAFSHSCSFSTKYCTEMVLDAQHIMKGDLYEAIMVEEEITVDSNNGPYTMVFFPCMISKPSYLLAGKLDTMVTMAASLNGLVAFRLLESIRAIVDEYVEIVMYIREDDPSYGPKLAALLKMSCDYMAFRLNHFNYSRSIKLPACLGSFYKSDFFSKIVDQLEDAGSSLLFSESLVQQEAILHVLSECEDLSGKSDETSRVFGEAVGRCLQRVHTVAAQWQPLLSFPVYCETMGSFLHFLLTHVMNPLFLVPGFTPEGIQTISDILSDVANHSIRMFEDPSTGASDKYSQQGSLSRVHVYLKNWMRFQEFRAMLSSTCQQVEDRWVNGKGPLAYEFTTDEVKILITALFPPSPERKRLLRTILPVPK